VLRQWFQAVTGKMVVGRTGFLMRGPLRAWALRTPVTRCTPLCTARRKCYHTSLKCATCFQGPWHVTGTGGLRRTLLLDPSAFAGRVEMAARGKGRLHSLHSQESVLSLWFLWGFFFFFFKTFLKQVVFNRNAFKSFM